MMKDFRRIMVEGVESQAVLDILQERGGAAGLPEAPDLVGGCVNEMPDGAYRIAYMGESVQIQSGGKIGFFRALGNLLSRQPDGPAVQEEDMEGLPCRGVHGVMYDCSRNGVLQVESVKKWIRRQALLGLERLFLYTEDTYEVEGYPYFGALRGRYTREEIQSCDVYAKMFGIELIPCIQTLAHLRTFLRWPSMMSYRDDEDILLADEEKTYALIDAMLCSVSRMFSSGKVHLGMDEARYLGLGRYRELHGVPNQQELMKRHLDRVKALCRKYGLEPMIWSDMFFVAAGKGDYYGVPADYEWPDSQKPDKDVTLVYWDYEGHDIKRYQRMAALHKKLSQKICFAGGAWIWNGLAPDYAKAMDATGTAVAGVRSQGVEDTFLTLWLDNGAETPMETGLPMLLYYSRCIYGERTDSECLESQLQMLAGESWNDILLLDRFDHIPGTGAHNEGFANPSKTIFYQDPLVGIFDRQFGDMGLEPYYSELEEQLETAENRAGRWNVLYGYYRLLAGINASKCTLGTRIRDAYLGKDRECMEKIISVEIPALRRKIRLLKKRREQLWMEEYKPNGYEVLDIRISGVEARLESAGERLRMWLLGEKEKLEELEEERIVYLEGRKIPSCNLWEHIVSACNIKGV